MTRYLLRHAETGPGITVHIALQGPLPLEVAMRIQVFDRLEVLAASMARRGGEGHLGNHVCIGCFILHSSCGAVRSHPSGQTARRKIDVAVERALVRVFLLFEAVIVIGQETLCRCNIDLALVYRHQLLPAYVPGHGTWPTSVGSKSVSSRMSLSLMGKFDPTKYPSLVRSR